jgi:hypothetical protein
MPIKLQINNVIDIFKNGSLCATDKQNNREGKTNKKINILSRYCHRKQFFFAVALLLLKCAHWHQKKKLNNIKNLANEK